MESTLQKHALEEFINRGEHARQIYGNQWGDPTTAPHLKRVKAEFIDPFIAARNNCVIEIGAGGGRWSQHLIGRAKQLVLVDGTTAFEAAIRSRWDCTGLKFMVSPDGSLDAIASQSVDFGFSFGTFVHFHQSLFDEYVRSIGRVLKHGGHFVLHYVRRWDEAEFNPKCFLYRTDEDIQSLLAANQMELTGQGLDIKVGFGSKVVVAQRVEKPKNSAT